MSPDEWNTSDFFHLDLFSSMNPMDRGFEGLEKVLEAIESLDRSMKGRKGGDSNDWFFLAMAEWRLGNKETARDWFRKAVEWMEKHGPQNKELARFRAEAEELGLDK